MLPPNGRQRIIITNVLPQLHDGKYPAKTAINDEVLFEADVFGDGHDVVAASLHIKRKEDAEWTELPMNFLYNDHWQLLWQPQQEGIYEYGIHGHIDHFATWKNGLLKKAAAGQDVTVDLEIGVGILRKALESAAGKEKSLLEDAIEVLGGDAGMDEKINLLAADDLIALIARRRDKTLTTVYPKTLVLEVERKKAGFSTWYELFPRSAASEAGKHGTFKDVERLLPRVARMGFDTLYFPPIHPIGEKNRKGRNNSLTATENDPGSPWAIGNRLGGHKSIHPELGTVEDFRSLVKAAKDHGIEIAMDIAYQCAPDHPYVNEHPQWFIWRPDGTVQYAENPPKKYEDILPFNFESDDWQGLWEELKSVIDYWIEQGINVFRIDNPHTKSLAFWEWMIGEVRRKNPQVIFLAEAFTRPRLMEQLANAGFNQSYTYFTWRLTKTDIQAYITELIQPNLRYNFRPNFWPNTPDILPPHLTQGGENAHIIRLLLAATLSSNYGLYGPVYEYGMTTPMPGKEEYIDNEKYELKHWDWDARTRIGEVITRINRVRKEQPALQTTANITFANTDNDQVICYCKKDSRTGNTLVIAVNLDPYQTQSANIQLPLGKLGMDYSARFAVRDLLSGDKYNWGERNYVSLNPWTMPAHVMLVENPVA